MKNFPFAFVLFYFLMLNDTDAQTAGVGYSSYFKKDIELGKAQEEALLDAEKNALISYGGYINISSTSLTSQTNTADGKGSTSKFDSKYHSTMKQLMDGMVKSVEKPRYEVKHEGNKKYVVAHGKFSIDLMNIGDMVNLYVKYSGDKIHVDFKSNGCDMFPKYFKEYLTVNKAVFLFPPEGASFVDGDFLIEIFKDHIDLHDKKTGRNVRNHNDHSGAVFKTFTFNDCNSVLDSRNDEDGIFYKTEAELFKIYLSRISDNIF